MLSDRCGFVAEGIAHKGEHIGHRAAHKLEAFTNYQLSHPEAVSGGLALDTVCSRHIGLLAEADAARVLAFLLLADIGKDTDVHEFNMELLEKSIAELHSDWDRENS